MEINKIGDYKIPKHVTVQNSLEIMIENEAATSTFAFMLSSVFSQYKDVVHVIPTKYQKAENLFDIVKHTIIGLEEISFHVLSITADNNAINKKAISFFCSTPKFSIVYIHTQL